MLDKCVLYPQYGFPVREADVGTKGVADLEEQVLGEDVGECNCNIRVMFYLAEA